MARGGKAAEVLGNQAFQAALTALENDIVQAWEACPARDSEGKEYYWQLYKNTKKFRAILAQYIEGGKLVKLRDSAGVAERVKNFVRR